MYGAEGLPSPDEGATMTTTEAAARGPVLSDPDLFRTWAYIDGAWVAADSGATFPVVNPATGETLAQLPRVGAAEARRAIEAASAASRMACAPREGALEDPAQMVRPHGGERRRTSRSS